MEIILENQARGLLISQIGYDRDGGKGMLCDAAFHEIANGNLQWIAGLNSGLTREVLASCMLFLMEVSAGEAVPMSMIEGIGERTTGSWLMPIACRRPSRKASASGEAAFVSRRSRVINSQSGDDKEC